MIIREPEVIGDEEASTAPGVRLLADASDTEGAVSVENVRLPAGAAGAGPHLHRISTEVFFVVRGQLDFLLGEEIHVLEEGNCAVVPPKTVHAFGARSSGIADIVIAIAPGVDRFEYFRVLGDIVGGAADPASLERRQEEFDTYFADSSAWEALRKSVLTSR